MKKIYFDYSATTPMDKRVFETMRPYFTNKFGNPSSIHSFGQEAMAGVDKAREQVAKFLNCEPAEIIFTSGATESNNLAIRGVVKLLKKQGASRPHVITSLIEHPAILEPCHELEKEGVEVSYLPVKNNGVVDLEKFKKAVKDNTVLVSIMHVNNETGAVQPIREIGKIIKKINEKKLKNWKNTRPALRKERPRPIYFHTDATQAVNYFNCDTKWNFVDLLSLSGHKIHGPKGVGVLYIKTGTPLAPIQTGGHQENNLRSGTYNAPGIVGLGKAVELLDKKSVAKNNLKIKKLRDMLVVELQKRIPNTVLNTDRENSTPAHANILFLGAEGESILISLDLAGIAVSTGSACASGKLDPSHVLLAMGVKPEDAHSSIRFSLGKYTTEAEIKKTIKILPPIIKKLRAMSPEIK
jgi:cysteine desulfurase